MKDKKQLSNPIVLLCNQRICRRVPHRIPSQPAVVPLSRPQSRSGNFATLERNSSI